MLAIGTSLPMILGFFFVRPIPLPHSDYVRVEDLPEEDIDDDEDFSSASPAIFQRENNSHTHLLGAQEDDYLDDETLDTSLERRHSHERMIRGNVVALSPTRPAGSRPRSRSSLAVSRRGVNSGYGKAGDGLPNVRGLALVGSSGFWLLFSITSLRKSCHPPMCAVC